MKTKKEITLNQILYKYGNRQLSQNDIAREFSVSRYDISLICIRAGFFRGKKIKTVPVAKLMKDPAVMNVLDKIEQIS